MTAAPEPAAPAAASTLTPTSFREALTPAELAFEQRRRRAGLLLAPFLFFVVLLLPLGLDPRAHRLAAVLAATIVLWITEAVPLPVTGLLGVALAVALGVDSAREALLPFSDHLIFLMIGGFILGEAIFAHGLNRRFAFAVLALPWVGARPARVLVAYAGVTATLSAWVSNTATTALMLPIGLSLLAFLYTKREGSAQPMPNREYATGLMLVTAFAASLGGLLTPIGTPTNLIGLGFLEETVGRRVPFFTWMALAGPIVVTLLAVTLLRLHRSCPAGLDEITGGRRFILTEKGRLGPLSGGERNVLVVFGLAVFLWVLPGIVHVAGQAELAAQLTARFPEGMVALLCASLLFFLPTDMAERKPTLTWSQAARIDWGTVLLLGSGMALGRLADRTGLAAAVGSTFATQIPEGSLFLLIAASTIAAVLISETTSNMAAVTLLVPLVISISQGAGVDPVLPALGATIGGSLGFMLPVSTPPNALVYGSGYVPISRMVRHGLVLDLAGIVVVIGVLYLLGPIVLK